MKKVLTVLVCLLSVIEGVANDAYINYFTIDGIYYHVTSREEMTVEVTFDQSYKEKYTGEVIIPDVVVVDDHGDKNGGVYNVTSIGKSAFSGSVGLTSVNIGHSIVSIADDAFRYCTGLQEFITSADNTEYSAIGGVLFNKSATNQNLLAYPQGRVGEYIIPDNIKGVNDFAFSDCANLTSIIIPKGCTWIGRYAFNGCGKLTSVTIPQDVNFIGEYAFANCIALESVTLPDFCTIINRSDFSGCLKLKEFIVSDNCNFYSTKDGVLFNKDKTNLIAYPYAKSGSYVIPNSVKYIVYRAFSNCSDLSNISIPNSVVSIPDYAFSNCSNLSTAIIPGSVNSIGKFAFSYCAALSSITIDNGLKSIGESAFSECVSLNSISIPNSVSSIGKALLSGCITLHKLSLPFIGSSLDKPLDSSRSLGYLFMSKTFIYPAQEDKIEGYIAILYGSTGQFSNKHAYYIPISLKEINVTNQMQLSDGSDDHRIFPGVFGGCTNLETINLPLTTTIGKYAFRTCSNLKSLSLPIAKSINYTQELTFPSSLVSLNIGNLENLSQKMLSNLSKLEELTIPFVGTGVKETATGVQGLFGDLFSTDSNSGMKATTQYYQDSKSKTYYLPANLRKVTVTEECEELQYGAFYGCSTIKEITLPYTLYMVGEKALYGCAGLTDIYCKGAAPAAAYDNSFTGIRVTTCKLHIPYNTTDLYKASDGWKKFFYMQEEAPLTVNVTKNILNAGIILGITEYQQGAMVNLSARANSGYRFKCWMDNGEIVSEEDNYSFTINENKNLLAVFIPVQNENSLIINTESNAVNFTWKTIDDTNEYILKIYSDIDMKKEIASYQFDAKGELVTRTASELSFRVTDLKPEVTYYYSLIANDKSNKTLSEQIGTFSTTPTGIEDISTSSNICIRVEGSSLWIENAQEKMISIYNLQGVCQTVIHKAKDMEMIQIDHSGIYLIKVDKLLQKVIIK